MDSATNRFFSIMELVNLLLGYLDHKAISNLMQTNHHLHELCTAAHYYNVKVAYYTNERQLFSSAESTQALARNVQYVRQLSFEPLEVVYFANCVFAYQDLLLQQANNGAMVSQDSYLRQQRPFWLAPPDPHTCAVFPVPPMTLLTKLDITIDYFGDHHTCPYHLPSFKDPRATLTYICWILDFNPHLLYVQLEGMYIKNERDFQILGTSIFGLKKLRTLNLVAALWTEAITKYRWASTFFFACPPSLQTFSLELTEQTFVWHSPFESEYTKNDMDRLQAWEGSDKDSEATKLPRREEPLEQLTQLWLYDLYEEEISEEELRSMLRHCPNLTEIMMYMMSDIRNLRTLAKEIASLCPKLTSIAHRDYVGSDEVWGTIMWMLEELPPQQVRKFECKGEHPFQVSGLNDVGSLFRRHSDVLWSITLESCQNITSKTIQTILVECGALERLEVRWNIYDGREQLCINLQDAIQLPWTCTRIQQLRFTIAIPDEPLHRPADGLAPFYKRPPPTTLSIAEKQQLDSLEALYRQIGTLTELKALGLQAVFYDPQGNRPLSGNYSHSTLPGMLNLMDPSTGRPGYLHHLAGLKKLRILAGWVSVTTPETKVTIGEDEVRWMELHWPALETAYFFAGQKMSDLFCRFKDRLEQKHNGRKINFTPSPY